MAKILFVVHRYPPFPGGSENFTRDMAEEMHRRGYSVTVLAHEHQGDQNRVRVTNDYNILVNEKWDLIIVHGCDVSSQSIVLSNSAVIPSPIVYMIIKPSTSDIALHGMKNSKYIVYSTTTDLDHILLHGYRNKARYIRHSIVEATSLKTGKYISNTEKPFYTSAAGFWPHKAMVPLANNFETKGPNNFELHLFGYAGGDVPPVSNRIKIFIGESKDVVINAMAASRGYIMNSYVEGFGLVMLEAMINKIPVYTRKTFGAIDISNYVFTYDNENELMELLNDHANRPANYLNDWIEKSYDYVMANRLIEHTGNDIEDILMEKR